MFSNHALKTSLVFAALILAGCETTPSTQQPTQHQEKPVTHTKTAISCAETCDTEQLKNSLAQLLKNRDGLDFFIWLDQSIAKNDTAILELLSNEHALNPKAPFTNLFLALTLSYPGTDFRDTNKAIEKLTTFQRNWDKQDKNTQFALFSLRQLQDRKNMIAQRTSLRERITELEDSLNQERDNASTTKEQLDQLKTIEKSLLRQQSQDTKKYRVVK